jgi:CPA2 family monovalent cation:H+ antiporter-2/glutathione-regulated potassium-efflux system ancillary protein KefC
MDLGVSVIKRETFDSALSLGCDVLQLLGMPAYEAHRLTRLFRRKDEEMLPELHQIFTSDRDNYVSMYQKHNADLEEIMRLDTSVDMAEIDRAWTAGNPDE